MEFVILGKDLLKLHVLFEGVVSLETFLFVEWHFTELANVLIFTPFLARSTNMAHFCRIFHFSLLSDFC